MSAGLLAGGAVGSLVTYRQMYVPPAPKHEVRYAAPEFDSMPEQMLFPAGFTLDRNVNDPELLEAMLEPDAMSIHLQDDTGNLVFDDWRFASQGVAPDKETFDRLKRALGSVSSYEPPGKLCVFHPDVLLRLEKGGRDHDIVFCFGCSQTTAFLDLSVQGKKTFLKAFCDTLPQAERLHDIREAFEKRPR
ncbi:hypothetical protein OKA04_10360 [Luteolibacter flavescens]|uniref:DUF1795 domain-containing protein n=1 Tax=Luteolibacter flavescens TaxID=1859460 RepID=A0ABT3FQ71_9BACT|nr:hypothetical protein [Luteolibacter flavescens]MCW1885130.1 hypothetical protein [Luteolibacter flavescens]